MLEASQALEKLIVLADPTADARVVAGALLTRYGSLLAVLAAPAEDLTRVEGVRAPLAQLLRLMPPMARYDALDGFGVRPDVSTFRRAEGYLSALYIGREYEHFYLLCLGQDGRLIKPALVTRGHAGRDSLLPSQYSGRGAEGQGLRGGLVPQPSGRNGGTLPG